jgi:hypothetical protein
MLRGKPYLWFAASLMLLAAAARAQPAPEKLDTLKDLFTKLHSCFKPPPLSQANPIDITVIVSFNRQGAILGRPRITYETAEASENDRLQYRIAVMQALERCTPLPFTDALGGAVAGRPMAIPFRTRKPQPNSQERRAWLPPKIL